MFLQEIQFKDRTTDELILEYKKTESLEIKQEIVRRHMYIVESSAINMRNVFLSFSEVEDMVNEGVIEIMNGLDRFDPSKGVKFSTYMYNRIRGMIIDRARKQDWVPRNERSKAAYLEKETEQLAIELGREPTDIEISDRTEIEIEEIHRIRSGQGMFAVLSLNKVLESDYDRQGKQIPSGIDMEEPEENCMEKELKRILADAIRSLNEREQIIVSLYYQEELNMQEIGEVLGLSKARISQIHSDILKKLTTYMEEQN